MDSVRRTNLIQKIIKVIRDQLSMKRPSWFIADRIVTEVVEPEIEKTKSEYERLFYTDTTDKH